MIKLGLFLLLWMFYTICSAKGIEDTFQHLKKTNPQGLYTFLKAMPKGGELHYHLVGSVYTETLLELAAKGNFCLNAKSFVMSANRSQKDICTDISAKNLIKDPLLYEKTIKAWSMQNFVPGTELPQDHFFNSFDKFYAIAVNNKVAVLASIIQRASDQQEQYLEIIQDLDIILDLPADEALKKNTLAKVVKAGEYDKLRKEFLKNTAFQSQLNTLIQNMDALIPATRKYLGCEKTPKPSACNVEVGFLFPVLREQSPEIVFLQTLYAFETASKSKSVVGVNLMQAEHGKIAVQDYKEHMKMFYFFHKIYPKVHISLHAGELSQGMVPPEATRFHILDAVTIGQAERIGHGVDIASENDAASLLKHMESKKIAVEINLTSNRHILNVTGKKHPLHLYLDNQVPVVLSTDDEGILRTDLTKEYYAAVVDQNLSLAELRQISRNALTYSFLEGKSIWKDADKAILISYCKDLHSQACLEFVAKNKKARVQRRLELKHEEWVRGEWH